MKLAKNFKIARFAGAFLSLALAWGWLASAAWGAVVVLDNHSGQDVIFELQNASGVSRKVQLPAGELVSIQALASPRMNFDGKADKEVNSVKKSYLLELNSIYYFGHDPKGRLDIQQVSFSKDTAPGAKGEKPKAEAKDADGGAIAAASKVVGRPPGPLAPVVIPVKILVDDDEKATQQEWERRLRERITKASKILEQHCHARLEVVAVGTWKSDNDVTKFEASLAEFEQQVDPGEARLAIGFTSQYQLTQEKVKLGGTRGALRSHLLVREWGQVISEPERLEVLVHELGHFFGAVHSPEPGSVMRPNLGDRKSLAKKFHIRYDALNSLAMSLLVEDLRVRPARSLAELSMATQIELRKIYSALEEALPGDPAAPDFLHTINGQTVRSLNEGARMIMRTIVYTAEQNAKLPRRGNSEKPGSYAVEGDDLADLYARQAGIVAAQSRGSISGNAYLIGLALALDDGNVLRLDPFVGPICRELESDAERAHRLKVLGSPSVHGRHDLVQHFSVSAALTAIGGVKTAEMAGLVKEVRDAHGGSGFSFVDYLADMSGIRFAETLAKDDAAAAKLQTTFSFRERVPEIGDLVENLTWEQFTEQYGTITDARFLDERKKIVERIDSLPVYKAR